MQCFVVPWQRVQCFLGDMLRYAVCAAQEQQSEEDIANVVKAVKMEFIVLFHDTKQQYNTNRKTKMWDFLEISFKGVVSLAILNHIMIALLLLCILLALQRKWCFLLGVFPLLPPLALTHLTLWNLPPSALAQYMHESQIKYQIQP